MAGIELLSTPPSSTRQWTPTPTGSRSNSTTVSSPSRSLSPRHFPFPLSSPATSPERVQFEEPACTVATDLKPAPGPSHSVVAHCTSPRSPGSRVNPRSPPPRPARPPTALSNIRPTIILSPFLVSSLPPADRPLLSRSLHGKQSFSTSSTSPSQPTFSSKSSTSDSRSCYSSLAPPSPCFFGPITWPTGQLPASSAAEHTPTAPSLPPRSPRRPNCPNLSSTRLQPAATKEARSHHRRKTGSGSGSASASSRNSHIPSPHPPSPPPFPPPTTPLPPTPTTPPYYINTTSNSESPLPSPSHEKQPLADSVHYQHHHSHQHQHHPLTHHLASTDAESTLALAPSRASSLDAANDENNDDTASSDDDEEATRPRPWRRRHKRHLWMLATAVLVALLVGGILGGIIWKLGRAP